MKRMVALLLLLISARGMAAVKVDAARFSLASEAGRLVLNLSAAPVYKVFTLPNPPRVVIDIGDARLATSLAKIDFTGSSVRAARSGIRNGRDLRLVLDMNAKTAAQGSLMPPSDNQGYRLVIDLQQRAAASPPPVPAQQVSIPNAPAAAAPAPVPAPVAAKTVPAPLNPAGLRDIVVAIDAGHGGVDPGAHGPHGVKEKDVTLAIAQQVQRRLAAEPGIKPVMIRDGDYFVPLRSRVNKARESKADLLISIHADAINDPSAKGSSVYILSDSGASSEAARWLAEKENAADLVGGVSLDNKDDVLKSVLLDLSQTATIEASGRAGNMVLRELQGVGKVHRRHVEEAGFVVLKAPDIPSMLVETAFISNPQEERKLNSSAYQKQLAAAIVEGVRDYFREYAPPGTKVALANSMRRHIITKGDTLSTIADHYGVSVDLLRVSNNLTSDRLYVGTVLRIPPSDGT